MSKTKKIISLFIAVALIMTMATVAIVSTSAAAKVYFEDSLNWGNITAYCYGGSAGEEFGSWPGSACTDEGNGVWSIEISGEPECIIFHANDDTNQTSNIPYAGDGMIAKLTGEWIQGDYKMVAVAEFVAYGEGGNDDEPVVTTTVADDEPVVTTTVADDEPVVPGETITVYFTNNWAFTTQNAYYWGTGADPEWPGVAMTFVETNEGGESIYSATIPATATGLIFNGEHDQQPGVIRQTVDITEFANNQGFFCVEEIDGKITVDTYEYNGGSDVVTTTVADDEPVVTTTVADDEPVVTTTVADDEPVVTTTVADDEPVVTTTVADDEPVVTTTVGNDPAPVETGIVVAGTTYDVPAGTTVTYTVDVTAARLFENVQAFVSYDSTKLELVRIKSDDPDVADWEVEGPVRCPNLDGVIFNAGTEGLVKFNASKVAGYNFKEEKVLVTLEFVVKDTAKNTIALTIEEMTIKGDGTESYFTGGQAVITDGISVVESLDYVAPTTTTTDDVKTTVTTTDDVKVTVTTTDDVKVTATTTDDVKVTVTTTDKGTAGEPTPDPTNEVGTTGTGEVVTPPTGAAAYIYIAIAIMAMVACAVVVLRKKAND